MTAIRHRGHPTESEVRPSEASAAKGSLEAIAKANDISHALLMIWVDKYRCGGITPKVEFVEKQRTYEAHVAALERKIGELAMEIDALGK